MKAMERLWLTANRKAVVPDGHRAAAFLWAAPGDEIPDEAAKRFGVNAGLSPASAKALGSGEDKQLHGGAADKGGGSAAEGAEPGKKPGKGPSGFRVNKRQGG